MTQTETPKDRPSTAGATPKRGRSALASLLFLVALILASTSSASAQIGAAISSQAVTPSGQVAANARITVCSYTATGIPCSPQAAIYSDPGLTPPALPQPYAANQFGNYTIFVAPGTYLVQVAVNQSTTYSYVWSVNTSGLGLVSGTGAPTISCSTLNQGQIYTNISNGNIYSCTGTAWVLGTGGGATLPASALVFGLTSTTSRAATYGDITSLFSGCSGTQYLGADGACHTATGGGVIPATQYNLPVYAAGGTTVQGSNVTVSPDLNSFYVPSIVTVGGGINIVGTQYVAGQGYANIAAAGAAAVSGNGCVVIPASYSNTDTWSNPSGVCVLDYRHGVGWNRGPAYPTDFGAALDGVTDSSAALQACMQAHNVNGVSCELPPSVNPYIVANTVWLNSASGGDSILRSRGDDAPAPQPEIDITVPPGLDAFATNPAYGSNSKVTLENLRIINKQTPVAGILASAGIAGGVATFTFTSPNSVNFNTTYWPVGNIFVLKDAIYPQAVANEAHTVPATSPYTVQVSNATPTNRAFDCGAYTAGCSLLTVAYSGGATLSPTLSLTPTLIFTSVAASSGGSAVYTGTITNGASNALINYVCTVTGFTNSVNNGTFTASASSAAVITLNNPSAVAETHSGLAVCVAPAGFYAITPSAGTLTLGSADASANLVVSYSYFNTSLNGQYTIASVAGNGTATLTLTASTALANLSTLTVSSSPQQLLWSEAYVGSPVTNVASSGGTTTLTGTFNTSIQLTGYRLMLEGMSGTAAALNDEGCTITAISSGSVTCSTVVNFNIASVAQTGLAILGTDAIHMSNSQNGNYIDNNQVSGVFWDDLFIGSNSSFNESDVIAIHKFWALNPLGYGIEFGTVDNNVAVVEAKCDLYGSTAKACIREAHSGSSPPTSVINIFGMKTEIGNGGNSVQIDSGSFTHIDGILMAGGSTSGRGGDIVQINGSDGANVIVDMISGSTNNGIYGVCANVINVPGRLPSGYSWPCATTSPRVTHWVGSNQGYNINGFSLQGFQGADDTYNNRAYANGVLYMGPFSQGLSTNYPSANGALNLEPLKTSSEAEDVIALLGQASDIVRWRNYLGVVGSSVDYKGDLVLGPNGIYPRQAGVGTIGNSSLPFGALYLGNSTYHLTANAAALTVSQALTIPPAATATVLPVPIAAVAQTALSSLSGSTGVFSTISLATPGAIAPTSTTSGTYATATNCASPASPAVCGSAAAGRVVVAASASTVVVQDSAVGANSEIQLTFDSSLGTALSVTCNTTGVLAFVSARTAGTGFTITVLSAAITNPDCISFFITN